MNIKELLQTIIVACILAGSTSAELDRRNARTRSLGQGLVPPGPFCLDIVFIVQNSCNVEDILYAVKFSIKVLADMLAKDADGQTNIALLTYNKKAKELIPRMSAADFLEAFDKVNITNAFKNDGRCQVFQGNTTDALAMIDERMEKYFPKTSNAFSIPRGKLITLYTDGVTFTSKFNMEEDRIKVTEKIESLQSKDVTFAPIDINVLPLTDDEKKTEFHLYTKKLATREFKIIDYFAHQFMTSVFRKYHCPINTA